MTKFECQKKELLKFDSFKKTWARRTLNVSALQSEWLFLYWENISCSGKLHFMFEFWVLPGMHFYKFRWLNICINLRTFINRKDSLRIIMKPVTSKRNLATERGWYLSRWSWWAHLWWAINLTDNQVVNSKNTQDHQNWENLKSLLVRRSEGRDLLLEV